MIKPDPTTFLIADISGYTEYLSGVEIDHAQDILADLISTVVTALRPTFRLAKLEGDAAFCFAPTEQIDGSLLLDSIERCYFGFRRRRRDVRQATSCECNACLRIPDLNLKFVAHHGLAIRQKVYGREELLGSDVIVVHRLLKNDVVESTGVAAYSLLSDSLVKKLEIDPLALGMSEHSETYDHLGEVKLWVHDLERRWQEEEARGRVFIDVAHSVFENVTPVDAPPQVVWEYLTVPGRRMQWQYAGGTTGIDEQPAVGGRRGTGTINHCMHGPNVIIEKILDWRPYDYFTTRSTMPGGAPSFVGTWEFEPTATGTVVHYRVAPPKKKAEQKMLEQLGPMFAESFGKGLAVLQIDLRSESEAMAGEPAQPALPQPRNADGFLAGIEPIQYVG